MKIRNTSVILSIILIILTITGVSLIGLRSYNKRKYLTSIREKISLAIKAKDYILARNFTYQLNNEDEKAEFQKKIVQTAISDTLESKNPLFIYELAESDPSIKEADENIALLLGRLYISRQKWDRYEAIQQIWSSRITQPGQWFLLEADSIAARSSKEEAIAFLNSKTLQGTEESYRLARLALLHGDDINTAFEYLSQALQNDPKNPDIHSFIAQLYESVGNYNNARLEYINAVISQPQNPLYFDQLAEFYLRHNQYALALDALKEAIQNTHLDIYWIKFFFWNKVTFAQKAVPVPPLQENSPFESYVEYLQKLPQNTFWNELMFNEKVKFSRAIETRRQDAFWLHLLQLLKDGQENEAYKMISLNKFKRQSWQPDLEMALQTILLYRIRGEFTTDPENTFYSYKEKHTFFDQLNQFQNHSLSSEDEIGFEKFLLSNYALSSAFLASGWLDVALVFFENADQSTLAPEWLIFGIGQSLRINRGNLAAIEFLKKQPETDSLQLLLAEVEIANQDYENASIRLQKLAPEHNSAGYRAAWLMTIASLEQNNFNEANKWLQSNHELSNSTVGKEIQARIALVQGEEESASAIYEGIVDQSIEAQAFFAHKAYQDRNWELARNMTLKLINEMPEQTQLYENLTAIEKAKTQLQ